MNRRLWLKDMSQSLSAAFLARASTVSLATGGALALSACAGPQISDYAAQTPILDLRTYFNGTVDAWGLFTDRSGRVVKRFTVIMDCKWQGDEGVLDEAVTYSDGTKQRRIWRLKALPIDGSVWHVQFDDWMYLMDERVMLNKAVMSKLGVTLGEVTLSFTRREPVATGGKP